VTHTALGRWVKRKYFKQSCRKGIRFPKSLKETVVKHKQNHHQMLCHKDLLEWSKGGKKTEKLIKPKKLKKR
jgi:hypothetical protein